MLHSPEENEEAAGDGRQFYRLMPGFDDRPWWQRDVPLLRTALVCATAGGTTLIHVYSQHELVRIVVSAYLTARGCGSV